jgi:hypothetical protein
MARLPIVTADDLISTPGVDAGVARGIRLAGREAPEHA